MKKPFLDEFKLLATINRVLRYPKNEEVIVGVESMDDCALIRISDNESMAVTSDFVRGTGFDLFKLGYLSYFDLGYFLIAANLSDLASVGARPIGLSTVIRYYDMNHSNFEDVFLGMKACADTYGAQIVGGDIGSYSENVFSATAFGKVITSNALLRKNVKDGDLLCVTGESGKAVTAALYLKEIKSNENFEFSEEEQESLLSYWKKPIVRIKEGLLLSESNLANACMDTSDGIKSSVEQLSIYSGKYFTIFENKIPICNEAIKLANFLKLPPSRIAISASVDFELLFTISKENLEECKKLFSENKTHFTVIGEVNNSGKNLFSNENNDLTNLPGTSWNQQWDSDYLKKIISR